MDKIRIIILTDVRRQDLEKGYQNGKNHALSKRCHVVLLKSEKRSSEEVSQIFKMSEPSVNTWLDRYESEGIMGLLTKKTRGRKSILNVETDESVVRDAIKVERQRLIEIQSIIAQNLTKTSAPKR